MGSSGRYYFRFSTFNLDIPLTLKKSWRFKKINIYTLFGPAIGVALSGGISSDEYNPSGLESEDRELTIGNDDSDDLRRFDLGIKAGTELKYKRFLAGISYTYGLTDISNFNIMKNRAFSVSIGYCFDKFK